MKDELVKALALDGHVRIYIDRTTHMVQEAKEDNQCKILIKLLSPPIPRS